LPPFGPAVQKLLVIPLEDDSAVESFEDVFMSDPGLTAELLVMANSAAYGGRSRVYTIGAAIRSLGLEQVRSLAATSALRSHMHRSVHHQYLPAVWAHSIASAVAAEALGALTGYAGLYTCGLTHDLGRLGLILAGLRPYAAKGCEEFGDIEEANQAEEERFGLTHSEAGGVVAKAWGFPDVLATCMSAHHFPANFRPSCPHDLIVTACQMADSLGFPEVPLSSAPAWPELDPALARCAQLEPETLWDQITERIADLAA
jgi:HD-like signal output (HDOD) protein